MTAHFGARLRQHREQQELSLATVADRTKIKLSLLEALERGDISHWPPGIYRRAYVRAYANAIGLDPDTVAREFLEAYPEPVEVVETPPPATGFRGLFGSAIGSLSRIRHTGLTPPANQIPRVTPQAELPDRELNHSAEATRAADVERTTETVPTMGRVPSAEPGPVEDDVRGAADPPIEDARETAPRPAVEVQHQPDLLAAARVCTELGRVETADQVQPLLRDAAAILNAAGLIVWVWDAVAEQLRPVLVHGYSEQVVAQLPGVGRDDDNVTAAAFRSAQPVAISGTARTSGALALPLLTPACCAGVLTIELPPGREETGSIRAVATFFAAMLAQLVGGAPPAAAEADEPPAERRRVAGS